MSDIETPTSSYVGVTLQTIGAPLESRWKGQREQANLTFAGEWRGRSVMLRMEANRQSYNNGWSEWRIWCDRAGFDNDLYGKQVTDTARSRLGAQFEASVRAWLDSNAFTAARKQGYVVAIRGIARELRPYGDNAAEDVRKAAYFNRDIIGEELVDHFYDVADHYENFVRLLNLEVV